MVTDLPLIAPTNGKSVFKQAYTLSGLQINCNTCKKYVSGVFRHVPGVFQNNQECFDIPGVASDRMVTDLPLVAPTNGKSVFK